MSLSKGTMLVMGLAAIGVVSGAATLAIAQAPSQDVIASGWRPVCVTSR